MTVSTTAITFVDIPQDKVTLAGNSGVGKTTLFLRFKTGHFIEDVNTIRTDGEFQKFYPVDGEEVSITLYDTVGIEKYAKINSTYFRRCKAIVFMYDITNRETFDELTRWEKEAMDRSLRSTQQIKTILLGNKLDLQDRREVSRDRALQFADNYSIPEHLVLEISAKTGEGVDELFMAIGREMMCEGTKVQKKPQRQKSGCKC